MIAYQKEKIENAICFFAEEHKKATRQPLYQTYLYKYLAFLEFDSIKETGRPALGLKFRAMEKGPVPIEIYEKRESYESSCFKFRRLEKDKYIIISKGKPNLDYFSPYEIKEMKRLIEIFANKFVKSNEMSESSHQDIKAWKKTWSRKPNSIIDYGSTFDEDIKNKDPKELTVAEENFLIYKSIEEASR